MALVGCMRVAFDGLAVGFGASDCSKLLALAAIFSSILVGKAFPFCESMFQASSDRAKAAKRLSQSVLLICCTVGVAPMKTQVAILGGEMRLTKLGHQKCRLAHVVLRFEIKFVLPLAI